MPWQFIITKHVKWPQIYGIEVFTQKKLSSECSNQTHFWQWFKIDGTNPFTYENNLDTHISHIQRLTGYGLQVFAQPNNLDAPAPLVHLRPMPIEKFLT